MLNRIRAKVKNRLNGMDFFFLAKLTHFWRSQSEITKINDKRVFYTQK